MYKDEILKGEIQCLENNKKELLIQLHLLNLKLTEKNNIYYENKKKFYFEKGLCSSCESELSEDDIKYKIIYCEECRENDSVLDWNSNY